MQQPNLFERDVCAGKSGNPPTSHAAFERIMPELPTIRLRVLAFAVRERRVTLHSVMKALDMSYPTASARLSELERDGLLVKTADREGGCAVREVTLVGENEYRLKLQRGA